MNERVNAAGRPPGRWIDAAFDAAVDAAAVHLLAVMVLVAAGCQSGGPRSDPGPTPEVVAVDEAALASTLDAHRRRIGLLTRTYSRGVIEFRWVDDDGTEHFEPQVNAKLWIDMPRRTALRGEKLGRDLLWLGSDADRFWFFDLTADDSVLYIGRHGVGRHGGAGLRDAGSPLPIEPLALLDLLGLTEIAPRAGERGADVRVDPETGSWIVAGEGAGGPTRIHLDRVTGLPEHVESLTASGDVLLRSRLGRYRSVDVKGVSKAALPKMPTLIDIADPDGAMWVKLALDEPSAPEPDDAWRTVFDLDGLTRYLQPRQTRRLGDRAKR